MQSPFAIVAGVELGSPTNDLILRDASRACQGAAALHIVSVVEPHAHLLGHDHGDSEVLRGHEQDLRALVTKSLGRLPASCEGYLHVRWGDPAESIVHVAAEANAQLIVVGASRGDSVRGTLAEKVERWAACPVLISREVDWKAKEDGFIPNLVLCKACVQARERAVRPHWFCAAHGVSNLRIVSTLDRK